MRCFCVSFFFFFFFVITDHCPFMCSADVLVPIQSCWFFVLYAVLWEFSCRTAEIGNLID